MRTAFLIPLAFATIAVAGCGDDVPDPSRQETAARAAALPERDLTLSVPRTAETEVASPIELARAKPVHARAPRPRPALGGNTMSDSVAARRGGRPGRL